MELNLIDTHCHLYHEQLAGDQDDVIKRAKEAGSRASSCPISIDRRSLPCFN